MGREATLFLLKQGVRVTGTDGWSWDAPFSFTAKRFAETGDASIIWEGHKAGREIGYCHMEKLSNLERFPPRLSGRVFPGEDRQGVRRVDAGGGDHRGAEISSWSMIFSENRYPLFGIMLRTPTRSAGQLRSRRRHG